MEKAAHGSPAAAFHKQMKNFLKTRSALLAGILAVAMAVGCTTTPLQKHQRQYKAAATNWDAAYVANTASLKATEADAKTRAQFAELLQLQKEYVAVKEQLGLAFDLTSNTAGKIGNITLGVGVSGVLAGIAAAALTVASPANGVWIAGLSGWAGGVAGINTLGNAQGLSKSQIVQAETVQLQVIMTNISGISFAQLKGDIATGSANFWIDATNVEWHIHNIEGALVNLQIPVVGNSADASTPPTKP